MGIQGQAAYSVYPRSTPGQRAGQSQVRSAGMAIIPSRTIEHIGPFYRRPESGETRVGRQRRTVTQISSNKKHLPSGALQPFQGFCL